MKYFFSFLLLTLLNTLSADPGDTTIVQAFTFGSEQDAIISFPDDGKNYERVLMHYTLRCVPGGAGGLEYPCGEWDYLTYTNLYHPTGRMDSTRMEQPSFLVNKDTSAQFGYQEEALYDRYAIGYQLELPRDYRNEEIETIGRPSGDGAFFKAKKNGTMQLILTAEQLGSLLSAGDSTIYGLSFESNQDIVPYRELRKLEIYAENIQVDDTQEWQELSDPVLCYDAFFGFNAGGFHRVHFLTDALPTWDGNSDVVFHLRWEGQFANPIPLVSDDINSHHALEVSNDGYLEFENNDRVVINRAEELFSDLNNEITISFWNYGDPEANPRNSSILEARDKNGQRILNIHLPWGNGRIYWDAGKNPNNNSYDRIEKAATNSNIEGQWNHWAFTKNAATGEMKIYLNGNLWHQGTDKSFSMEGIDNFYIGSMTNGNFYRGKLDELRIWNKSLDEAEIRAWMNRSLDNTHPAYDNLKLYYNFDGTGYLEPNLANTAGVGEFYGIPDRKIKGEADIRFDVETPDQVPLVYFLLNGDYDYQRDVYTREDTVYREPVALELFYDTNDPELRTSLSYVWVPDTTFFYFNGLTSINQLPSIPEILDLEFRPYFSDPFEVIERFELGRYITPYGIGIDLGEGWTWIFDVTDYLPLLKGDKRLTAGNWQEWLDLKFLFIEGTPSREVKRIQNVHSGRYEYRNSNAANNNLENKKMGFLPDSEMAKFKVRNSGHGFGGNLNCAEFCPRNNRIMVNGQMAYSEYFWRDDCGLNPLKGQGGTWVYNRSNWCPGDLVQAYEYELTDLVDFSDSVRLDYHLQDGYTWNGNGSVPYYRIENQLVEYGPVNHNLDIRIEEIIAPNEEEIYGNDNPLCGKPIVRVRNTGKQTIESINFYYGIEVGLNRTYELTDLNLSFDEVAEYELPLLTNGTWPESENQRFFAEVIGVNGTSDDYVANNKIVSNYVPPRLLNPDYDGFIVSVRTNNNGNETTYRLKDGDGNVLLERTNLASNRVYNDTFYVDNGCYEFEILDSGNDGLQWWANSAQGSGYATIRGLFQGFGLAFIGLDPDFGSAYKVQFTAGELVSNSEEEHEHWGFELAPNPVSDYLGIQMKGFHPGNLQLEIRDQVGRSIFRQNRPFDGLIVIDQLENMGNGVYWLTVQQEEHVLTKKFVVAR